MNIEDVKQMRGMELNEKLTRIICPSTPKNMSHDFVNNYILARKAQAKAMSKDFENYIYNLANALRVPDEHFTQVDLGYVSGIQHVYIGAVANMLQAAPRQICEASYITLQEVQSNGR